MGVDDTVGGKSLTEIGRPTAVEALRLATNLDEGTDDNGEDEPSASTDTDVLSASFSMPSPLSGRGSNGHDPFLTWRRQFSARVYALRHHGHRRPSVLAARPSTSGRAGSSACVSRRCLSGFAAIGAEGQSMHCQGVPEPRSTLACFCFSESLAGCHVLQHFSNRSRGRVTSVLSPVFCSGRRPQYSFECFAPSHSCRRRSQSSFSTSGKVFHCLNSSARIPSWCTRWNSGRALASAGRQKYSKPEAMICPNVRRLAISSAGKFKLNWSVLASWISWWGPGVAATWEDLADLDPDDDVNPCCREHVRIEWTYMGGVERGGGYMPCDLGPINSGLLVDDGGALSGTTLSCWEHSDCSGPSGT
jgi:hypothetical protein